jgi:hypothetical protein
MLGKVDERGADGKKGRKYKILYWSDSKIEALLGKCDVSK